MRKIGIIFSRTDPASLNVYNIIQDNIDNFFIDLDKDNIELILTNEKAVFLEKITSKKKMDNYIFMSKHSSRTGKPSMLVHSVGNWSSADLGGKDNTIGFIEPYINKILYSNLCIFYNKEKDALSEKFDITLEATHHGPYLDKPVVFLEIGSTEKEWNDEKLGWIMFRVLKKSLRDIYSKENDSKNGVKNLLGIGGLHYAMNFNNIQESNPEYAIGHICPKYYLENITKDIIIQAITKTLPRLDGVVLDTKALGTEKERLVNIFQELGLKIFKYKELKIEK